MTLQLITSENFGNERLELIDNGREYVVKLLYEDKANQIRFVIEQKQYAHLGEAASEFNHIVEDFGIA